MQTTYWNACLSQCQVYDWCKKFAGGTTLLIDALRPGQAHPVMTEEKNRRSNASFATISFPHLWSIKGSPRKPEVQVLWRRPICGAWPDAQLKKRLLRTRYRRATCPHWKGQGLCGKTSLSQNIIPSIKYWKKNNCGFLLILPPKMTIVLNFVIHI